MSVALFGVGGGVWGFSLRTGESGGGWGIILGGQRWVENIFGWGGGGGEGWVHCLIMLKASI